MGGMLAEIAMFHRPRILLPEPERNGKPWINSSAPRKRGALFFAWKIFESDQAGVCCLIWITKGDAFRPKFGRRMEFIRLNCLN
jgi:hypothetical protein